MTMLGLVTKVALWLVGAGLLIIVINAPQFEGEAAGTAGASAQDFAEGVLVEFAWPLIALAALLAMALIGAAYLVRDERLENLARDAGWEDES